MLPRFGADLQSVIDESGNVVSASTVANIARQVVSAVETFRVTLVSLEAYDAGMRHFPLRLSTLYFFCQPSFCNFSLLPALFRLAFLPLISMELAS